MRNIRDLAIFIAICTFTAVAASAQAAEKPANPAYDEALAKKLGADNMGMRSYVIAILKTGPNDAAIKGEERTRAFRGHFENMTRLSNEGKLAVAGPFGTNDKTFRGLFILAVAKVEEARLLADTDPAVKAGIFVVEFVPWYGSASLMATPDIHKKIAKTNP